MANKEFEGLLKSEITKAVKAAEILTGETGLYIAETSEQGGDDFYTIDCSFGKHGDHSWYSELKITITCTLFDRRKSYVSLVMEDGTYISTSKSWDTIKAYKGYFKAKKEEEKEMTAADKDEVLRTVLTERAIAVAQSYIEDRVVDCGAYFALDCSAYVECIRKVSELVHGAIGLIDEDTAADIMEAVDNTTFRPFDSDFSLYIVPDSESETFWRLRSDAGKASTKAELVGVYENLAKLEASESVCRQTYLVIMAFLDAFWGQFGTLKRELSVQDTQEIVSRDFAWTVTEVCQGDTYATIFCEWQGETKRLIWSWRQHRIIQIETV